MYVHMFFISAELWNKGFCMDPNYLCGKTLYVFLQGIENTIRYLGTIVLLAGFGILFTVAVLLFQELDEKEYLSLWLVMCEIRNRYCSLHDIVIKNLEKIKKPRSSNTDSLY